MSDDLTPLVAASFTGGNSHAARSARAKLQWRDRYGRWVEMGRGIKFKVRLANGSTPSVTGKFVGAKDPQTGQVYVKGDPNGLKDGFYDVNSANAQEILASLGQDYLQGRGIALGKDTAGNTVGSRLDKDIPNIDQIPYSETPQGWKVTERDANGNATSFTTDDGDYGYDLSAFGRPMLWKRGEGTYLAVQDWPAAINKIDKVDSGEEEWVEGGTTVEGEAPKVDTSADPNAETEDKASLQRRLDRLHAQYDKVTDPTKLAAMDEQIADLEQRIAAPEAAAPADPNAPAEYDTTTHGVAPEGFIIPTGKRAADASPEAIAALIVQEKDFLTETPGHRLVVDTENNTAEIYNSADTLDNAKAQAGGMGAPEVVDLTSGEVIPTGEEPNVEDSSADSEQPLGDDAGTDSSVGDTDQPADSADSADAGDSDKPAADSAGSGSGDSGGDKPASSTDSPDESADDLAKRRDRLQQRADRMLGVDDDKVAELDEQIKEIDDRLAKLEEEEKSNERGSGDSAAGGDTGDKPAAGEDSDGGGDEADSSVPEPEQSGTESGLDEGTSAEGDQAGPLDFTSGHSVEDYNKAFDAYVSETGVDREEFIQAHVDDAIPENAQVYLNEDGTAGFVLDGKKIVTAFKNPSSEGHLRDVINRAHKKGGDYADVPFGDSRLAYVQEGFIPSSQSWYENEEGESVRIVSFMFGNDSLRNENGVEPRYDLVPNVELNDETAKADQRAEAAAILEDRSKFKPDDDWVNGNADRQAVLDASKLFKVEPRFEDAFWNYLTEIGYNAPAARVSYQKLEDDEELGERVYRAIYTEDGEVDKAREFAEQYRGEEKPFGMIGVHGTGTYFGTRPEVIPSYGNPINGSAGIIDARIHPEANLIDDVSLTAIRDELMDSLGVTDLDLWNNHEDVALAAIIWDQGALAAALGYDGVRVGGQQYIVSLNRGKMTVADERDIDRGVVRLPEDFPTNLRALSQDDLESLGRQYSRFHSPDAAVAEGDQEEFDRRLDALRDEGARRSEVRRVAQAAREEREYVPDLDDEFANAASGFYSWAGKNNRLTDRSERERFARWAGENISRYQGNGVRYSEAFDDWNLAGKPDSSVRTEAAADALASAPEWERSGRPAGDAYEAMEHDPFNPEVIASYDALANAVIDQYRQMKEDGLTIEFSDEDPYGNSAEMVSDVEDNDHIAAFADGGETLPEDHPMNRMVDIDGESLHLNDVFRAVHDYFGHYKSKERGAIVGFGPKGEWEAWRTHRLTLPKDSWMALWDETRGQNTWTNYYDNHLDLPITERPYAEQKAGAIGEDIFAADLTGSEPSEVDPAVARRVNALVTRRRNAIEKLRQEYGAHDIPANSSYRPELDRRQKMLNEALDMAREVRAGNTPEQFANPEASFPIIPEAIPAEPYRYGAEFPGIKSGTPLSQNEDGEPKNASAVIEVGMKINSPKDPTDPGMGDEEFPAATHGDVDAVDVPETISPERVAATPTGQLLGAPARPDFPYKDSDEDYADEKFMPTTEQRDVIQAVMSKFNTVVQALAGTGKTSTLVLIAKQMKKKEPERKGVYVVFNKKNQEEGAERMPDNFEVLTMDALVHRSLPKNVTNKLNNDAALIRPDDIADYFEIGGDANGAGEAIEKEDVAQDLLAALNNWAISADPDFNEKNFEGLETDFSPEMKDHLDAMWADLKNPNGVLKLDFNHMAKMWALNKPDFKKPVGIKRPADVMFVDEAQDLNPVFSQVLRDQDIQIVVVGDANQSIYGFRGAQNEMDTLESEATLPLTQSWRFGPQVAGYGNRYLSLMGADAKIVGGGPDGEIVQSGSMEDPDAILTRSNGGALTAIMGELEKGRIVGTDKNFKKEMTSFVASVRALKGGYGKVTHPDLARFKSWDELEKAVSNNKANPRATMFYNLTDRMGLDAIDSAVAKIVVVNADSVATVSEVDFKVGAEGHLMRKSGWTFVQKLNKNLPFKASLDYRITDNGDGTYRMTLSGTPDEKDSNKWAHLNLKDELKGAGFRNVKDANGNWSNHMNGSMEALENAVARLGGNTQVDVVVSTAHKAKGLEWGKVKIGDDFRGPDVDPETGDVTFPQPEEIRLAYVAVTRAQKQLDPGSLSWITEYTSDDDERPDVPSRGLDAPDVDAPEPTPEFEDFVDEPATFDPVTVEDPSPVLEDVNVSGPTPDADADESPEDTTESEPDSVPAPEPEADATKKKRAVQLVPGDIVVDPDEGRSKVTSVEKFRDPLRDAGDNVRIRVRLRAIDENGEPRETTSGDASGDWEYVHSFGDSVDVEDSVPTAEPEVVREPSRGAKDRARNITAGKDLTPEREEEIRDLIETGDLVEALRELDNEPNAANTRTKPREDAAPETPATREVLAKESDPASLIEPNEILRALKESYPNFRVKENGDIVVSEKTVGNHRFEVGVRRTNREEFYAYVKDTNTDTGNARAIHMRPEGRINHSFKGLQTQIGSGQKLLKTDTGKWFDRKQKGVVDLAPGEELGNGVLGGFIEGTDLPETKNEAYNDLVAAITRLSEDPDVQRAVLDRLATDSGYSAGLVDQITDAIARRKVADAMHRPGFDAPKHVSYDNELVEVGQWVDWTDTDLTIPLKDENGVVMRDLTGKALNQPNPNYGRVYRGYVANKRPVVQTNTTNRAGTYDYTDNVDAIFPSLNSETGYKPSLQRLRSARWLKVVDGQNAPLSDPFFPDTRADEEAGIRARKSGAEEFDVPVANAKGVVPRPKNEFQKEKWAEAPMVLHENGWESVHADYPGVRPPHSKIDFNRTIANSEPMSVTRDGIQPGDIIYAGPNQGQMQMILGMEDTSGGTLARVIRLSGKNGEDIEEKDRMFSGNSNYQIFRPRPEDIEVKGDRQTMRDALAGKAATAELRTILDTVINNPDSTAESLERANETINALKGRTASTNTKPLENIMSGLQDDARVDSSIADAPGVGEIPEAIKAMQRIAQDIVDGQGRPLAPLADYENVRTSYLPQTSLEAGLDIGDANWVTTQQRANTLREGDIIDLPRELLHRVIEDNGFDTGLMDEYPLFQVDSLDYPTNSIISSPTIKARLLSDDESGNSLNGEEIEVPSDLIRRGENKNLGIPFTFTTWRPASDVTRSPGVPRTSTTYNEPLSDENAKRLEDSQREVNSLLDAYDSGEMTLLEDRSDGGIRNNGASIYGLPDGRKIFVKAISNDGWHGPSDQVDAEYLTMRVGNAIGIDSNHTAMTEDENGETVVIQNALEFGGEENIKRGKEILNNFEDEPDAQLLGLMDIITGQQDRHVANYRFAEKNGSAVPIDNEGAEYMEIGYLSWYSDFGDALWRMIREGRSPMSSAELMRMMNALASLEPDFTQLGHVEWFDTMMYNIARVIDLVNGYEY